MTGSSGEQKIVEILNKGKIIFEREKTFSDLKGFGTVKLRYDFYLPDYNGKEVLIEFQGIEHYKRTAYFQKEEADFKRRQIYDEKKISYSLANKISLYCIPYWVQNDLNEVNDLFREDFLAKTKDHNYTAYRLFLQQKQK